MHQNLQGKTILLIGTGSDTAGLALAEQINGTQWNLIARINRYIGNPADIGTRTNIILTQHREWATIFDRRALPKPNTARIIAFWDGVGVNRNFTQETANHLNITTTPNTNTLAAHWLLTQGAIISAIGLGINPNTTPLTSPYTQNELNYLRKNITIL